MSILKNLYQHRAERLKTLATENHPFSSYLNFAAEIVQAQQKALYDNPLSHPVTGVTRLAIRSFVCHSRRHRRRYCTTQRIFTFYSSITADSPASSLFSKSTA
ncbi:formate dehydrogenase accessory protein FdhE [Xenorhabdus nematophila]|uniref:FdhE N-terminal domain-containing protein n=1 Tax=Xenorhabdus nematophila (strain ATCC 19061 / DSM 3370 / CCUG 14189 / LMG 1036 / NCIMB 9965 / AN6) TaxID=406817 RepID=D3VG84_XENNA|nr:formate dehydrogenase accessory protein FdhE [Xenorhabdus nematophila]CBJ88174.1 hypothetical protein XNC1_0086 [Xenorhabdus nematophila ATCC 19061]CCW30347.1 conserved hypothetical protein [Xenorhabdus nematophila F1]CEE94184.1 hypothetical protein XNA1_4520018 [Xenorhabdus nematophila str. Anatoliense]CEF30973.1 hypothetical protein XNW1_30018 [Xenorhabdus nematophila str. Websteri]CEK21093.1 hypothetical protein XNC2_0089 [Xenorhabdus nematophila AN6/1]